MLYQLSYRFSGVRRAGWEIKFNGALAGVLYTERTVWANSILDSTL